MATVPQEEPSISLAVVTLAIGVFYLVISILYLSAWLAQEKKRKEGKDVKENKNQESI
jgi:heme/copper-type cytochrome/quinol oxidase subunit 2